MQVEFRTAASRWRARMFLEAFARGEDPYQHVMEILFGPAMWTWDGAPPKRYFKAGIAKGSTFDRNRTLAKSGHLAFQYGATVETGHSLLTKVTDKDGNLMFLSTKVQAVHGMRRKWLEGLPEYEAGWAMEEQIWRDQGYIAEPVTGRRRDFTDQSADKVNISELVNFPNQAGAAGLMNLAANRLLDVFAEHPDWHPIAQIHDQFALDVPERDEARAREVLREVLEQNHPGVPGVDILAELGSGPTLADC